MAVNEAVRDLLREASSESLDQLYERSQRAGLGLGRNTIARAKRGDLDSPRVETVEALAELFDVDVRDLRAAVGWQPGELGPWTPDPRSASLTKDQRDALDRLIVTIVTGGQSDAGQAEAQKRPGGDDGGAGAVVTPIRPDGGGDSAYQPIAARRGRSQGRQLRAELDKLGEENQDTGGEDPS